MPTSAVSFLGIIQMKTCSKCKETKPLSEFYKDKSRKDGCSNKCIICQREYYQSKQYKLAQKRYCQSKKGKVTRRSSVKRFYINHPERFKAKDAVKYAIATGKITPAKKLNCTCGKQVEQYHHWSYLPEYWFDVQPVCRDCHIKMHRRKSG